MIAKVRDPPYRLVRIREVGKHPAFMDVEEKLLTRLRLSEEETLGRLVTHRHVRMIRIAMRYVAGRHVAEEVETNLYARLQRARE